MPVVLLFFAMLSMTPDEAYQNLLRAQYIAICGAPDCRNSLSENELREQFERELLKQNPGLAFQMELQDRQKKHFEQPPAKETLRSDHVQSI